MSLSPCLINLSSQTTNMDASLLCAHAHRPKLFYLNDMGLSKTEEYNTLGGFCKRKYLHLFLRPLNEKKNLYLEIDRKNTGKVRKFLSVRKCWNLEVSQRTMVDTEEYV